MAPTDTIEDAQAKRVERLRRWDAEDLAKCLASAESERYDLVNQLEDAQHEIERLKELINSDLVSELENVEELAERITSCVYEDAEIVSVDQTGPITARIILEARMSAGDTMHVFPGERVVLSFSDPSDFSALENHHMKKV